MCCSLGLWHQRTWHAHVSWEPMPTFLCCLQEPETVKHFVSRKNRSCGRKRNVAGEVPVSWGDGIGMLVANRCAWLTTEKREKGPCPALSPALSKSLACSVRILRGVIIHPGERNSFTVEPLHTTLDGATGYRCGGNEVYKQCLSCSQCNMYPQHHHKLCPDSPV